LPDQVGARGQVGEGGGARGVGHLRWFAGVALAVVVKVEVDRHARKADLAGVLGAVGVVVAEDRHGQRGRVVAQPADPIAGEFGEPEGIVRPAGDAERLAKGRGH
jgi:hypothetical protein